MKTYTKRILTWLMVIAMLTGIILTDYRAPVFSRAEEATVTQANTDGTSASSSTETGEQTGPQTGETEQTGSASTPQGSGQGEQGENAPANQTAQGPEDITKFVDITLWEFGIAEKINSSTYKIKTNGYIVKEGTKQDPIPEIKQEDNFLLHYKWAVEKANMKKVRTGNYFEIKLPNQAVIKTDEVAGDILSDGKKIGVFLLKDGVLKATFDGDFHDIDYLKDGYFELWAYAVKGEGQDQNIDIPIKQGAEDTNIFQITVKPPTPPTGGGAFNPGGFPEQNEKNNKAIVKAGWQDQEMKRKGIISYTLTVNFDWLNNSYQGLNPGERSNIIVSDLLPSGLELNKEVINNQTRVVYISAPIYFPAMKNEGTKESPNWKLSGKLSSAVWWGGSHRLYPRGDSKMSFGYYEGTEGTWEEFLEAFKKTSDEYNIGVWKGEKDGVTREGVAVKLGSLPHKSLAYSDLFGGKDAFFSKIEGLRADNKINEVQLNKMKEFYGEKKISAYHVVFYTKMKDSSIRTYINTANVKWEEGGSTQGEEDEETYKAFKIKAGVGYGTEKVKVKVEKVWNNKEKQAPVNIEKLEFDLIENGDKTVKSFELSKENGWTWEDSDLNKTHDQEDIIYTVKEKTKLSNYAPKYSSEKDSSGNNITLKITNTELTEVKVEKKWSGNSTTEVLPEVKVKLLKNDAETGKALDLKGPSWTGSFTDLDKYDETGQEIKYKVVEVTTVPNYKSKVTGDMNVGFTITNTKAKINIPVTKKWTGFDVGKGPDDVSKVEVVLWADEKPTTQKLTLNKDNQWKGQFKDLDVTDSEGNSINYIVKEVEIPWYETKVEQKNATDITQGFTITNTKVPPITITVDKKWVRQEKDSSYTDLPKNHKSIPKSIEVQLIRKGVSDVEVETKELTKEGGWETTFAPVPSKDSNGNPIQYAVKEKEVVTGFALAEQVNVQNGKATLTNILTDRIVNIKIDKKWMKGNNELTNVSETEVPVEILYRKKGSKDKFESYQSDLKIEKIKGWKLEVKGLPEIDLYGDELEYAIREVKIPSGYFGSLKPVEGKDLKFTLTNTVIPKREIKVVKKWLDEKGEVLGNEYLRIPNEVKVKLWKQVENSGWEDTGEVITLAKPNWTASFTGLDTVNHLGEQITYRIQELEGTGEFAKEFTHDGNKLEVRNDQQQVVITNKKTLDQVVIKIDKKWLDLNNSPITDQQRLPDGVKFSLFADGQFKKVIMVSRSKGWQYTERLPKFDANGKEIVYTIKEADLYGYTATIQKESGGLSFTATNKENPTPPGNPFIPPFIPDEPVPTPPNIPTPPAPNVPIDELVIEDDEVVLAGNDEEDLDDPEITDEPEDEEITDDLPRSNKDVPKTADFFMSGFANPLAVSTVIMMGYGLKKLVAKKKKD